MNFYIFELVPYPKFIYNKHTHTCANT